MQTTLNSIERINACAVINKVYRTKWDLIQLTQGSNMFSPSLTPRLSPLVAALSLNEIVILGGFNHKVLGDGYVYNLDTNSVEQVIFQSDNSYKSSFRFGNTLNQSVTMNNLGRLGGKIAGLVADGSGGIHFITYTKGDSEVKQILPKEH